MKLEKVTGALQFACTELSVAFRTPDPDDPLRKRAVGLALQHAQESVMWLRWIAEMVAQEDEEPEAGQASAIASVEETVKRIEKRMGDMVAEVERKIGGLTDKITAGDKDREAPAKI
jgi:hypothetical protein